jgi:lysyl-tRNA synthetase class 2
MIEPITRVAIKSNSLVSIGYSAADRVLEAEFRSGEVYRYFLVPATIWEALQSADSKGAFINERVRDHFPVVNITPAPQTDLSAALEKSLQSQKSGS